MDGRKTGFGESAREILAGVVQDENMRELLRTLGVEETMLNAIHLAICLKALGGDVQAAKYLRDTAEEAETEEADGLPDDFAILTDRQLRALAALRLRQEEGGDR